jgi:hypothetical protein
MISTALSSRLNSVTEEFYERSAGSIFEKDEDRVKIEVQCYSSVELLEYGKDGYGSVKQVESEHGFESRNVVSCPEDKLCIVDLNVSKLAQFLQVSVQSLNYGLMC